MNSGLVQQLIDRQEITDVLNQYCRALDRMDLRHLSALFTDGCVVDYGPEPWLQSRGAAALEKSLERMWRWTRTSHHLSNVQISFHGDGEALVSSYVQAWHERSDGSTATVLGQYQDRFVHLSSGLNSGWRIAERRMVMNGSSEDFRVNINRLDRIPPPADWLAPRFDDKS